MAILLADGVPLALASPGLTLVGTSQLHGHATVPALQRVTVIGTYRHEAGVLPHIRFSRAGVVVKDVAPALHANRDGTVGFREKFTPGAPGVIIVNADGLAGTGFEVVKPFAELGDHGEGVTFLQQRLRDLRYATPVNGRFDGATGRAVVAYRKVNRMARVTLASREIMARLNLGQGAYRVRYPYQGRHAEGDLSHQVLALVGAHGVLHDVYVTSSGRPALRTPTGHFRVYKQELGVNSLGEYDMQYFKGICGIHGYFVVPTYNQSHCCLRVPIPNARAIRLFLHRGDLVDTFYRYNAVVTG